MKDREGNGPKMTRLQFSYRSQRLTNEAFIPKPHISPFAAYHLHLNFWLGRSFATLPQVSIVRWEPEFPNPSKLWGKGHTFTIQDCSPRALCKPGTKNILLNGVIDCSHGLGLLDLVDLSLPLYASNNLKRSLKEVPPAPTVIISKVGGPGLVTASVFSSIKLI